MFKSIMTIVTSSALVLGGISGLAYASPKSDSEVASYSARGIHLGDVLDKASRPIMSS